MKERVSPRNFRFLSHPVCGKKDTEYVLAGESSVIDQKYEDAMDRPGSSRLWFGPCELNREEVAKFRDYLTLWLTTGRLHRNRAGKVYRVRAEKLFPFMHGKPGVPHRRRPRAKRAK